MSIGCFNEAAARRGRVWGLQSLVRLWTQRRPLCSTGRCTSLASHTCNQELHHFRKHSETHILHWLGCLPVQCIITVGLICGRLKQRRNRKTKLQNEFLSAEAACSSLEEKDVIKKAFCASAEEKYLQSQHLYTIFQNKRCRRKQHDREKPRKVTG